MPNYDYACDKCEHVQEETHSLHDDPTILCDDCGGLCRRLIPRLRRPHISNGGAGYQPGLARFPNDPRAYVDGRHSLQKLVDQRRRETGADPISPAEIAAEHQRELDTPFPEPPWGRG